MKSITTRNTLRVIILIVVASIVIGPLLAAFFGGFKGNSELRTNPLWLPDSWDAGNYIGILLDGNFWRYLGNSFFISLMTVFLTLVVGAAAAYVFSQIRFFGAKMILSYLLLGLMFPFAAAILPLFIKVRDLGLLDTYWAVILPQTAFGLSLAILLFKAFFDQLPKELFEAAYVDGCSYLRFFWSFTLSFSAISATLRA